MNSSFLKNDPPSFPMDKRKIGITITILSLLLGVAVINLIGDSKQLAKDEGCFKTNECNSLTYALNMSHLGIGLLFAFFSLGMYLIFFGRTEEALLRQLEQQKTTLSKEDKLKLISTLLSANERKLFETILQHEGITQNTLRIKTELSKATVSQILSDFERKDIIRRELKGKTYSVYLKNVF